MNILNIIMFQLGYLSDTNTSTYAVPDTARTSTLQYHKAPPPAYAMHRMTGASPLFKHPEHETLSHLQRKTQYGNREMFSDDATAPPLYITSHNASTNELAARDNAPTIEFPHECLRFLEKLGEGLFGEVRTLVMISVHCNYFVLFYLHYFALYFFRIAELCKCPV